MLHPGEADRATLVAQRDQAVAGQAALKAAYDRLELDSLQWRAHADALAAQRNKYQRDCQAQKAAYDQLELDTSQMRAQAGTLAAQRDHYCADAMEHKLAHDRLEHDNRSLTAAADKAHSETRAAEAVLGKHALDAAELAAARTRADSDLAAAQSALQAAAASHDALAEEGAALATLRDQLAQDTRVLQAANQKLQHDALEQERVPAGMQKSAFDKVLSDNARMAAAAADQKQAYDHMVASREKLQYDMAEQKLAYDGIAASNAKLQYDAVEQKLAYDGIAASNAKLQYDAVEQKQAYDHMAESNAKLVADACEQKQAYDDVAASNVRLQADAIGKLAFDEIAASHAKLEADAVEQKRAYDQMTADHSAELAAQQARHEAESVSLQEQHDELLALHGDLQKVNEKLQRQKAALETELDIAHGIQPKFVVDVDSLGSTAIRFLNSIISGGLPDLSEVVALRELIRHSKDLWRPPHLEEQIAAQELEADVVDNLVHMLGNRGSLGGEGEAAEVTSLATIQRVTSFSGGGRTDLHVLAEVSEAGLVPLPVNPLVEQVLRTSSLWCWDAFALRDASNDHPLSTLAFFLFQQTDLVRDFQMDERKLARYLCKIEGGYRDNPYHNRTHAADVLHALFMLATEGGLYPNVVDKTGLLACFIAAIVHDYEHTGLTNDFLVNTGHELAMTYNDRAPQESHHLSGSFQVLAQPEHDFLANMTAPARKAFRAQVIDMVLATDMKSHFSILSKFRTKLNIAAGSSVHTSSKGSFNGRNSRRPTSDRQPGTSMGQHSGIDTGVLRTIEEGVSLSRTNSVTEETHHERPRPLCTDQEERAITLQMALKVADISHLACSMPVHRRWVLCLEEEFFRQGEAEAAAGLPVSPLMARGKPGVSKSQVGFFDIVALPLFRSYSRAYEGSAPFMFAMMDNYQAWRQIEGMAHHKENK